MAVRRAECTGPGHLCHRFRFVEPRASRPHRLEQKFRKIRKSPGLECRRPLPNQILVATLWSGGRTQ